jgi:hypothetical protein
MRIAKSRLKEIILEEIEEADQESTSDLTLAERVLRLESALGNTALDEGQLLAENPALLASLAPQVINFVIKDPKIMQMLAGALMPLITKAISGAGAAAAGALGGAAEE